jgi:pseudouridine synthase
MQLNRYLALCGVASRRKANRLILEGKVVVNGRPIDRLGMTVDPENDAIVLEGKRLERPGRKRYILLNKPTDTVTTIEDDRGRKTVLDVVRIPERVFPIGRLDMDTVGVLLLTNDGDLAFRLAHPRYEAEKVYRARVAGRVSPGKIALLEGGVDLGEGVSAAGRSRIVEGDSETTVLEIRLHEGRKRQVKRMCAAIGHPVLALERIRFAGLEAGTLKPGQWRDLSEAEVDRLYEMTGLLQRTS